MEHESTKRTIIEVIEPDHTTLFLTLIVILLGLVFLLGGGLLAAGHDIPHEWGPELLREVGLALLIAAVVGFIYETSARTHFVRSTISVILSKIFDTVVREDVWQEVADRILKKDVIREGMTIHIEIPSDSGPDCNPTELHMTYSYQLKGLHTRPGKKTFPVMHYLDDYLPDKERRLPRFEDIVIGGRPYPPADTGGVFTTPVKVSNKEGESLEVKIKRIELTYVPGLYNVTMTEMTKGITLILGNIPGKLEAVVDIRPQLDKKPLTKGEVLHYPHMMLWPGQNIEFRFRHKAAATTQPSPTQPAPPSSGARPGG